MKQAQCPPVFSPFNVHMTQLTRTIERDERVLKQDWLARCHHNVICGVLMSGVCDWAVYLWLVSVEHCISVDNT